MVRMGLVVFAVLLGGAGVAGAGNYVAIDGKTLYRRPDTKSQELKTSGLRILEVIAKRGAWFEVKLTKKGGHCGVSGGADIGLRLFVQVRDTVQSAKRNLTRRLGKGTSVYLRKGAPLWDARLRRLIPSRFRSRQFKFDRIGFRFSTRERETTQTSSVMTLGNGTQVAVSGGVTVGVRRRAKKRWLVEHTPRPCVRLTGWMPRDAFVAEEEHGVAGGVPGGVVGGVLGGAPATYWLRAGSEVSWPDGTQAGRVFWRTQVKQPPRPGGSTHCEQLSVGNGIRDQQLCFRTSDLQERYVGGTPPPPPSRPRPPAPKKAIIVPQVVLDQRTGNRRIVPDEPTKKAITRAGNPRVITSVKMCLSAAGRVTSLSMITSSGYPDYDQKIRAEMRRWTYRPFRIKGKAVPVCTSITFIYRQTD